MTTTQAYEKEKKSKQIHFLFFLLSHLRSNGIHEYILLGLIEAINLFYDYVLFFFIVISKESYVLLTFQIRFVSFHFGFYLVIFENVQKIITSVETKQKKIKTFLH